MKVLKIVSISVLSLTVLTVIISAALLEWRYPRLRQGNTVVRTRHYSVSNALETAAVLDSMYKAVNAFAEAELKYPDTVIWLLDDEDGSALRLFAGWKFPKTDGGRLFLRLSPDSNMRPGTLDSLILFSAGRAFSVLNGTGINIAPFWKDSFIRFLSMLRTDPLSPYVLLSGKNHDGLTWAHFRRSELLGYPTNCTLAMENGSDWAGAYFLAFVLSKHGRGRLLSALNEPADITDLVPDFNDWIKETVDRLLLSTNETEIIRPALK